jgi:flagellar basal body-associated protein FliL
MAWLENLLFRGSQRHERRTKLRVLIACVIVGLLVAAALAAAMFFMNKQRTG